MLCVKFIVYSQLHCHRNKSLFDGYVFGKSLVIKDISCCHVMPVIVIARNSSVVFSKCNIFHRFAATSAATCSCSEGGVDCTVYCVLPTYYFVIVLYHPKQFKVKLNCFTAICCLGVKDTTPRKYYPKRTIREGLAPPERDTFVML